MANEFYKRIKIYIKADNKCQQLKNIVPFYLFLMKLNLKENLVIENIIYSETLKKYL